MNEGRTGTRPTLESFEVVVAEFDALAEDALQLCDQHISAEVRKETQLRIIERVQRFDAVRAAVEGSSPPVSSSRAAGGEDV